MRRRIRSVRIWGLVIILLYWSSVVWLPFVLRPLGVPGDSSLFRRALEIYYWPTMKILGGLTDFLPYPAFMFYGPLLAAAIPALVCAVVWWLAVTAYLKWRASDRLST